MIQKTPPGTFYVLTVILCLLAFLVHRVERSSVPDHLPLIQQPQAAKKTMPNPQLTIGGPAVLIPVTTLGGPNAPPPPDWYAIASPVSGFGVGSNSSLPTVGFHILLTNTGTTIELNGHFYTVISAQALSDAVAANNYTLTETALDGYPNVAYTNFDILAAPTDPSPPPAAPTITLTVTPASGAPGSARALHSVATNATSVSINQGVGVVTGDVTVNPTVTTIYTATATGAGGTATSSATATVVPTPTASLRSPSSLCLGLSLALAFAYTGGTAVLTDNQGGMPQVLTGGSGTATRTPTVDTIYTLTVTGPYETTPVTKAVVVLPLPTATLSASPATINVGDSSLLTFGSTGGSAAAITPMGGSVIEVSLNGTLSVAPAETTDYKFSVLGSCGAVMASQVITVTIADPAAPDCCHWEPASGCPGTSWTKRVNC